MSRAVGCSKGREQQGAESIGHRGIWRQWYRDRRILKLRYEGFREQGAYMGQQQGAGATVPAVTRAVWQVEFGYVNLQWVQRGLNTVPAMISSLADLKSSYPGTHLVKALQTVHTVCLHGKT